MNGLVATDQVLVLGIGNLLWADEGFGVRCAETLGLRYRLPETTVVMDGGTQGLYLLPYVQQASHLLVFDAVDYGLPPGELIEVHDDEVPKFTGAKKMSLHQTGFQEVLSAADFTGRYPRRLTLIGVQACELDNWGGGLTGWCAAGWTRRSTAPLTCSRNGGLPCSAATCLPNRCCVTAWIGATTSARAHRRRSDGTTHPVPPAAHDPRLA